MNKYIKTDIENGVKQIKIGLLNALHEIIRNEIEIYEFKYIPLSVVLQCLKQLDIDFYCNNSYDSWSIRCPKIKITIEHELTNGNTKIKKYV